ncbi:hypothetical protein ACQ4PT_068151 [Festuca glaucescens]
MLGMAECKGRSQHSPSSSMDSSNHPALSTTASPCRPDRQDLSTDLRLGLSLSTSPSSPSSSSLHEAESIISNPRNQVLFNWPPIKPFLRSALAASASRHRRQRTLFVKVYMEGLPIGRKLDLLSLVGYDSLLIKLCHMFKTPITYAAVYHQQVPGVKATHILTYEDQDGDWMMVGDVPWELFLTSVKKLKITGAGQC